MNALNVADTRGLHNPMAASLFRPPPRSWRTNPVRSLPTLRPRGIHWLWDTPSRARISLATASVSSRLCPGAVDGHPIGTVDSRNLHFRGDTLFHNPRLRKLPARNQLLVAGMVDRYVGPSLRGQREQPAYSLGQRALEHQSPFFTKTTSRKTGHPRKARSHRPVSISPGVSAHNGCSQPTAGWKKGSFSANGHALHGGPIPCDCKGLCR